MKHLFKLIYFLEINTMFIIDNKTNHSVKFSVPKLISNICYCLIKFKIKKFIILCIILFYFIFVNIIKVLYFPIIILFFFSRFRFCQINFSQIGILNLHFSYMIKRHVLDGKIPLIFIPKGSKFDFLKEIFKNIIIIDNRILYLLSIPLRITNLISFSNSRIDTLLNNNLEFELKDRCCDISNQFQNLENRKIFEFKSTYNEKMVNHIKELNLNFDLSKTFIVHIREIQPKLNNIRSVKLSNYIKSINYLLEKNYNVIRLTDSFSNKLSLSKNYYELRTDKKINQKLQYYLVLNSRGFIGSETGPSSISTVLSTPMLETNVNTIHTQSVNTRGLFTLRKVKRDGKYLTLQDLNEMKFYSGLCKANKFLTDKNIEIEENNEEEILGAIMEFEEKLNFTDINETKLQKKFKSTLPDYIELKYYKSNISNSFLEMNPQIFRL